MRYQDDPEAWHRSVVRNSLPDDSVPASAPLKFTCVHEPQLPHARTLDFRRASARRHVYSTSGMGEVMHDSVWRQGEGDFAIVASCIITTDLRFNAKRQRSTASAMPCQPHICLVWIEIRLLHCWGQRWFDGCSGILPSKPGATAARPLVQLVRPYSIPLPARQTPHR